MEKKTSSANRLVLKRILAQEGNNKCADCKTATHPRWASWNIGILICIRCSGIHRSLGTHISKVRSIDLDTWNDTQLEKLVEFGNIKANAYWEAQLPPNHIPDESKILNFIKTKYELKRWIPKDGSLPSASRTANHSGAPPPVPPKVRSSDLLDLDGAFSLKSGAAPHTSARSSKDQSHFGDFKQARPAHKSPSVGGQHPTSIATRPLQSQPQVQSPSSLSQANRADVKKSILSLYSQPAKQAPAPTTTPSFSHIQQQGPQPSRPTFMGNGLYDQETQKQSQPSSTAVPDEDNFASVWN